MALTTKPDYDPNEPRVPLNEATKKQWENLSPEELQNVGMICGEILQLVMPMNQVPHLKIITAATALEENIIKPKLTFIVMDL